MVHIWRKTVINSLLLLFPLFFAAPFVSDGAVFLWCACDRLSNFYWTDQAVTRTISTHLIKSID